MKYFCVLAFFLFFNGHSHAQIEPMKISLDGEWLFVPDSMKVGLEEEWYQTTYDRSTWSVVQTPNFWESYPQLGTYDGWGWYARKFQFNKTAQPVSIYFAGVDDDAVVWINGEEVGSHTGYSEPFAVDVTHAIRSGENEIVVQVLDYAGGGGIYKPVTLVETRNLEDLLKGPYSSMPARKSADWVKDAVIYEVYLRSVSPEGTFVGLEHRLPELRSLGVTVLWLMPIHPVGLKNRKGSLGSPYAVQDYYGINPEFGTLEDFKHLLAAAHAQNMKLIIDLVANHTSWDSKLVAEHPEWFTHDASGQIVPPNKDWTDVADLDYSHQTLRKYMIDMMVWWVRDIGIDGFRCDVAELVPTDFWEEARARLDKIKPIMMLSEGSLPEHHVKAFDVTYSWNVYDVLEVLFSGKRPATLLDEILKTESLQFPQGSLRMRFHTNHDKNAWDAPAIEKFGEEGFGLAAVLAGTLPGVPMLYNGEEVANNKRLDLFEKVSIDWSAHPELRKFFEKLYTLRKKNHALSRGSMIRAVSQDDQDVYAFFRVAGKEKVFVVLNFSAQPRFTSVRIPMERVFPGRKSFVLREVFRGETTEVSTETSPQVVLALEPRDFRVYVVEKER